MLQLFGAPRGRMHPLPKWVRYQPWGSLGKPEGLRPLCERRVPDTVTWAGQLQNIHCMHDLSSKLIGVE